MFEIDVHHPRPRPAGAHRVRALPVLLIVAGVGGACGGPAAPVAQPPAPVVRVIVAPPGVDSAVVAEADSLASTAFVEPEAEDEALALRETGRDLIERSDSLWAALTAARDRDPQSVSADEEVDANEAVGSGGQALVALDDLLRDSEAGEAELIRRTAVLLDSAEAALERAFQLNPFESRTRLWLAQVYELQARRLGQSGAFSEAVAELEKLTLLTPDQHAVYAMLANNYFQLSDWERAAIAYREASEVYLATRELVLDEPPALDSALVFGYVRAEGEMHVRRLNANDARAAYRRGFDFVVSEADSAYLQSQLDWIDWDGGDIANAMARDSLAALADAGSFEDARAGFARLAGAVSTRGAADELDWRLAIVEYNLGESEVAATRLQALAARTPKDAHGRAADPTYGRYLEDYGTLCLNFGRELIRDRRDSRTALMYFTQATTFGWSGRPLAFFEVARLLQANVPAALEAAQAALEQESTLSDPQRADLYRLLMELHRRAGDFDRAREFRDAYRALTSR